MGQSVVQFSKYGSTRFVICLWRVAVKFPRNPTGRHANTRELKIWRSATAARRQMLCPILLALPLGLANVMSRAIPLTDGEMSTARAAGSLPDWDYGGPHDISEPTEPKSSDWGYFQGRIVALDYGLTG